MDSTEADAIRSSTATGGPLEVMTKSPLPADLSHCYAGFFRKSVTEIVLMAIEYVVGPLCASRAAARWILPPGRNAMKAEAADGHEFCAIKLPLDNLPQLW